MVQCAYNYRIFGGTEMKKEILVLVLLICIMLIGCAKAEDPRDTGSTMGEPDASVSEQNIDVLPTDGSSNAPEPTDVTEPADAADEDADLYKLPTVIGTYTDIYAEIGELEVMHYYPFAEFNSEEYHVSNDSLHTLFLCDENNEEKNCAIFIGEDNSACLICRNLSVEKLLFDGYIWDFSKTFYLNFRYPTSEYLHKNIEELSDYSDISDQLAVFDGGMVFDTFPMPLAIKGDKAYRLDKGMLFCRRFSDMPDSTYLISNGTDFMFETISSNHLGTSDCIAPIFDENADIVIGYRAIGIDFSRENSPFYIKKEMTVDEYMEKKTIHGDCEEVIQLLSAWGPIGQIDDEYAENFKRRIREENVTTISKAARIHKELGDRNERK